jgi:Carboxypeptidase regulatory-like domain
MNAFRPWVILLAAVLTLCPVFAQNPAATASVARLDVAIHDLEGKAIPRATVTLQTSPGNLPPGGSFAPRTAQSDDSGIAHLTDLAPGLYRLTIIAKGFDELSTDVTVNRPEDVVAGTQIDAILTTVGTHADSITVQGVIDTPLQEANTPAVLERQQVKDQPDRPRTVTDALPLSPGIVRLPNGDLRLSGSGEHRSALLVNSASVTDPATGQFGATVPIDSVASMSVLTSPFLAEYGGFTSDVVAVETRKGGDKWSFELNDPLPEFRFRSWHMVGIRSSTPRVNFGGPLKKNRLYFLESVQYDLRATPVITLPFPNNETRREAYNSLTALDYTINPSNVVNGTFHVANEHTRFDNLDFFNPQPVTPTTYGSSYSGAIVEHASFRGTLLDSAIAATSFRAGVWGQGTEDMVLTPTGNEGNYFTQQTRTSSHIEWRETWSFSKQLLGTHNLKFGSVVGGSAEHALVTQRPVDILDGEGRLIENITFTPGRPIARTDVESAFFAQDQWILNSHVSLNMGVRVEQQEVTDVWRVGPRAALVYSPFHGGRTIFRAGAGIFYDRVPLNVYGFALYPDQIITTYNPDGTILSGPYRYFNLTEPAAPHHSPLIYRQNGVPGNFAPYSINSNLQVEQILSPRVRLRVNYLQSNSSELIVLYPEVTETTHAYVLNGNGNSRLRQLEATGAAGVGKESQIFLSYVHSSSIGNLNEFNTYLANFPPPVILPDARTFLPGDMPNRFLAWGVAAFPHKFRVMPKIEYRTGFPWSSFNAAQQYVGIPNSTRFPNSFSVDARVTKDVKVTDKYSFRFGVSGSNLTNHFNPISIHANTSDPAYGLFFGVYHRRYTADFDVLF